MRVFLQRIIAFLMSVITFLTGGLFSGKKDIGDIKEPTIYIEDVSVSKSDATATVKIHIVKNPGIAGAKITVSYDSGLTLKKAESGAAFSPLQFTRPGRLSNPCSFTWDSESGMATADGIILSLTFDVPADARRNSKYAVNCTYQSGDIYNEALNDVTVDIVNGFVYIK